MRIKLEREKKEQQEKAKKAADADVKMSESGEQNSQENWDSR